MHASLAELLENLNSGAGPAPARDGFDKLMQALRAEIRDPLRAARAALPSEQAPSSQHELIAGLDRLLTVVEHLVELADLWDLWNGSSSALLAHGRVELWPLLQQAWAEVEPLALERGVTVRFRSQDETSALATLCGNEKWLGRVFQESLESAVRSAPPGCLLDVEYRQAGPRAVVVFRDSGVFAEQDQAGLRLCRHIVSLHGGQLREEEEDEHGRRNFVIELPTGAPHTARRFS